VPRLRVMRSPAPPCTLVAWGVKGAMPTRRLDDYFRQLGAAARSRQVDVEALLRRAVEAAVEETLKRLGPGAVGDSGGLEAARLDALEDNIRELRGELEELRRSIEELRAAVEAAGRGGGLSARERRLLEDLPRAVAEAVAAVLQRYCRQPGSQQAQPGEPRWLRILRERLSQRGYLFTHELPPELQAEFDPDIARKSGLVVAPLAGDHLVATKEAFNEFLEKLRGLKTGDEYEAEAKLGKYRILFRILRGEGMVYYGGPSRGWVLSLKI